MRLVTSLFLAMAIVSCNETKTESSSEVQPKEEYNYSYGKLYRDSENKFRIQYPSHWEIVSGEAKHTAIKFINRDSSMSLSVNVMYDDGSMSYDKLSEAELANYKNKMTEALNSANKPPIDMTVENGFLDSRNAVLNSYKFLYKQIEVELMFHFYQIQALRDGKIYTITLSLPDERFTQEFKSYINNFLYSFRFD